MSSFAVLSKLIPAALGRFLSRKLIAMQKLLDKTPTTLEMIKWGHSLFGLSLIFCTSLVCAQSSQKTKADVAHPLTVHVSASHIQYNCPIASNGCSSSDLYANVTVNGKKLELMGPAQIVRKVQPSVLLPGDYPARILSDTQAAGGSLARQEYELVLADGTVWHALVTGITE
jgi:hypothetical protein